MVSIAVYLIIFVHFQYMQTFKNVQNTPQSVLASEDIEVIFCKIPELHRMHFNFINNMEPKLENWTGEEEIAENFKILVSWSNQGFNVKYNQMRLNMAYKWNICNQIQLYIAQRLNIAQNCA